MSRSVSRLSLRKKLVFSVVTTLILLSAAELVVRSWVYYLREPYERFDLVNNTFVLVPGVHRARGNPVVVNTDGFVGKELEPDGEDLWRIVTLGDSNTFGGGDDVNTYPARLEVLLDAKAQSGRRHEVVNAGIQGLDSGQALRRLVSAVVPLEPEVVTVYIGWNDLMKYDPYGQVRETRFSLASRSVDSLWLVKGMRKLLFFYLRTRLDPPRTGPEGTSGRFADFEPTVYESNVREILAAVRQLGASPVLITLPTVVRRDMTLDDLREAAVYFPYYPSAYGVGDLIDLVDSYNRAIRKIARDEEVLLIDLASLFAGRADYRRLFYDTMHPTDAGQQLIADHLASELDRAGLLGDARSLD